MGKKILNVKEKCLRTWKISKMGKYCSNTYYRREFKIERKVSMNIKNFKKMEIIEKILRKQIFDDGFLLDVDLIKKLNFEVLKWKIWMQKFKICKNEILKKQGC